MQGQSVGGVAVSFVNFIAACWENPTDFITAHCGDTLKASTIALDVRRILISEQKSSSCFPYRKVDWSVFLYFFLGSLLLVACLIGYSFIDRFGDSVERRDDYETVRSIDGSMPDSSPRIGLELHGAKSRNNEVQVSDGLRVTAVADRQDEASSEADALFNDHDPANETAAVWRHVRGPATCIFLTFLVTLSLFPGWISDLRSVRQCKTKFRLANDLYIPFVFLLFNIGDLTGRLLLARVPLEQIRNLPTKLVAASSIRLLFFPVLFLCNGGSRLNRTYIHSDIYSLTVQFAFAVSNGFLLSASFVHAPSLIPNTSHTQERMSEILSFAVAFGLLCGSLLSFPVSSFVGR